jgi:hypothetical protein
VAARCQRTTVVEFDRWVREIGQVFKSKPGRAAVELARLDRNPEPRLANDLFTQRSGTVVALVASQSKTLDFLAGRGEAAIRLSCRFPKGNVPCSMVEIQK